MVEMKNLQVFKNYLKRIGGTAYKAEDGTLKIICSGETANIEAILLRNILLCFGEKYKILAEDDFVWDTGDIDIAFSTNLPYSIYTSL